MCEVCSLKTWFKFILHNPAVEKIFNVGRHKTRDTLYVQVHIVWRKPGLTEAVHVNMTVNMTKPTAIITKPSQNSSTCSKQFFLFAHVALDLVEKNELRQRSHKLQVVVQVT